MNLMMKRLVPALVAMVILCGPATRGFADVYEETEKKHSWFSFSRPAKDTPAEQMAHAENLLKERKAKKAGRAFRSLVITWPSAAEAPMAQWALARILDQRGDLEDAFDAYQVLMEKYTGRFPDYAKVQNRQFEICKEIMEKRRGRIFFGGFTAPERAIPYLEQVIKNGPRSPFAAEAQFLIGQAYEASFDYDLAVMAYSAALHRYRDSEFAEAASLGRARSLFAISEDYPNDLKALEEAWAGVMVFIRDHAASTHREEVIRMRDTLFERKVKADYDIAVYYDRIAKKPEAALMNYERIVTLYPDSEKAGLARKRLDELNKENAVEPSGEETL